MQLASPLGTPAAGAASVWSSTTGFDPSGLSDPALDGVSCLSAGNCEAAGLGGDATETAVAAQLSGGGSWSSSALSIDSDQVELQAISCVSTTWCVAVGGATSSSDTGEPTDYDVVTTYNGSGWSNVNAAIERASASTSPTALTGVSCTSQTSCAAVGYYTNANGAEMPIVMQLEGSAWIPSAPSWPSYMGDGSLLGVSCASATVCTAVGDYYDENISQQESLIVVLQDGTWTPVTELAETGLEGYSDLTGVSCPTTTWCEAVGSFTDPSFDELYGFSGEIEGTSWQPDYYEATPSDASYAQYNGVSCPVQGSCVAVGVDEPNDDSSLYESTALIATLSNEGWDTNDSSADDLAYSVLNAVSCSSDFNCQAVGSYDDSGYGTHVLAISGIAPPVIDTGESQGSTSFQQGSPSTYSIAASGLGPVTLTEVGGLPSGVSFSATTTADGAVGTLSGTPGPYTGDYQINFVAVDAQGNQTSIEFYLNVRPLGPHPPAVRSDSPNNGPSGGGNTVTVTGEYFTSVVNVMFGSTPAESFDVLSSTKLTAVAPPGAYPVTVRVVSGEGESSQDTDFGRYVYDEPELTSVSPTHGHGGTSITIKGQDLYGATAVWIGDDQATSWKFNRGATAITAIVPTEDLYEANVVVDSPAGAGYLYDAFTYDPPTVTSVSPKAGPYGGGNTITIHGYDLFQVYEVDFDDTVSTSNPVTGINSSLSGNVTRSRSEACDCISLGGDYASPSFTVSPDGTAITAVVPAGLVGKVDVVVQSYNGTTAIVPGSIYTISAPTITSVQPNTANVGSLITVFGTGLSNVETVHFGTTILTQVYYDTANSFVVQVPPDYGPNLTVDITVTDPAGTTAVTPHDRYTY